MVSGKEGVRLLELPFTRTERLNAAGLLLIYMTMHASHLVATIRMTKRRDG
jgi:hypothetical protein